MSLAKFIAIPAIAIFAATPALAQDDQSDAGGGTLADTLWVTNPDDFTPVDMSQLSTEELVGSPVYSADEEPVGQVESVEMDGPALSQMTVDVGGVLGFGETPLIFQSDLLRATQNDETGEVHVITTMDRAAITATAGEANTQQ